MADARIDAEVLVIGAGPAGLAAAVTAAEAGRSVVVVDDNPSAGGQIWRGEAAKPRSAEARRWLHRADRCGLRVVSGTQVFARASDGPLLGESSGRVTAFRADRIVLAVGARELFLPFPGWTLPGVAGVGGLQALVKSGLPIEGKRVVVAGSGPLLLAAAAYLAERGAEVRCVAEAAGWDRLFGFGWHLLRYEWGKLAEAAALGWALKRVPYRPGVRPVRAVGDNRLAGVRLTDGADEWDEPCDWLACAFGLVPNTELPALLGCRIADGAVAVDKLQRTDVPEVFCAGEPTGIGGLELSVLEGRIAGWAAAGRPDEAGRLFADRERARRFARALAAAFAPGPELRAMADDRTVLCRCEDVTLGAVRGFADRRHAKLQTRCGMGPCQGRICGPAAAFLLGWGADLVRPPVLPVPLSALTR